MPVSAIPDVTLSAVTVRAGGSPSTVAGGTEVGSTLGATLLVETGVDEVTAELLVEDGAGASIRVGMLLVPALGFTTLTCPAFAAFAATAEIPKARAMTLFTHLPP